MKCPICGCENPDDYKFCHDCGNPLVLNDLNQNDEKYDMNTKLALSHSIPNFRNFNYNAQDNSDYRRYSPYTNHYGESKKYFY